MSEYHFHSRPPGVQAPPVPAVRLDAASAFHGAALALRHFVELGCDITVPLAHVDITEPDGASHVLLVEEVLDWLHDPEQTAFVRGEGLAALLRH